MFTMFTGKSSTQEPETSDLSKIASRLKALYAETSPKSYELDNGKYTEPLFLASRKDSLSPKTEVTSSDEFKDSSSKATHEIPFLLDLSQEPGQKTFFIGLINEDRDSNELYFKHLTHEWVSGSPKFLLRFVLRADISSLIKKPSLLDKDPFIILASLIKDHPTYNNQLSIESISKILSQTPLSQCLILIDGFESLYPHIEFIPKIKEVIELAKRYNLIADLRKNPVSDYITDTFSEILINYGYTKLKIFQSIADNYLGTVHYDLLIEFFNSNDYIIDLARSPIALKLICNTLVSMIQSSPDATLPQLSQTYVIKDIYDSTIKKYISEAKTDKTKTLLITNFLMKAAFHELIQASSHVETALSELFLIEKDLIIYNNIFPILKIEHKDDMAPKITFNNKYREFLAAQFILEFMKREDTSKLDQTINAASISKEPIQVLRHVIGLINLIKDNTYKSSMNKIFIDRLQLVTADHLFDSQNELGFVIKAHVVAEMYELGTQIISLELNSFIKSVDDHIILHLKELKSLIINIKYKSPSLISYLMEILIHEDEGEILNSIEILTKIDIRDHLTKNRLANQLIIYASSSGKPDIAIAAIKGLKTLKEIEQVRDFFVRSLDSDNLYASLSAIDFLSESPIQRNLDVLMSNFHTLNPLIYLATLEAIQKFAYLIPNKKILVDLIIINLIKFENIPRTEIVSYSLELLKEYRKIVLKEFNNIKHVTSITNINPDILQKILILIKYDFFLSEEISTIVSSLSLKTRPSSPFSFSLNARLVEQHLPTYINIFKILNQAYSLIHEDLKKEVVGSLNYILLKYNNLTLDFLLHCEQIIISNPETFLKLLLDQIKSSSVEHDIAIHTLKLITNAYNFYDNSIQIEIIETIKRSYLRDYHKNLATLNDAYCLLFLKALPTLSEEKATNLISILISIKQNIQLTPNYLRVIAKDLSRHFVIDYLQEILQSHSGNELKFVALEEFSRSLKTADYSIKSMTLNILIEAMPSFTDIKLKIECVTIIKDLLPSLSTPEVSLTIEFITDRLQNETHFSVILELIKFIKFHAEYVLKHQPGIFELLHSKIARIENEEIIDEFFSTLNNIKLRSSLTKDIAVHVKAISEIINNVNADYIHRKSAINVLKHLIVELSMSQNSPDIKKHILQAIHIYLDDLSRSKTSILANHLVKAVGDIYAFLPPNSKQLLIDILITRPSDNQHYFNLFIKLINDKSIVWKSSKLNQLEKIFLEYSNASLISQNNLQNIRELDELIINHLSSNMELSSKYKDKIESFKELIIHRIINLDNTFLKQAYLKLLISLDIGLLRTIEFAFKAELLLSPSITELELKVNDLIYLLGNYPDNALAANLVSSIHNTHTSLVELFIHSKELMCINTQEVVILTRSEDMQKLPQKIFELEPSSELARPRRYSEPFIPPPAIPLKRSHSDGSPVARTNLAISESTFDRFTQYSSNPKPPVDPESLIIIQPINVQTPKKVDLSSVIAGGGLMKFAEVWPSTKFLMTKYIPIIPVLDNYNLLPYVNYETQHFILSSLYTFGAISLGITLHANPYVVGASITLFWLKPYIYNSKEALVEYIDNKLYLDQFSRNTINFVLESSITIGTSLPFLPLNSFASAPILEKATLLLPFLSQASFTIVINNMDGINLANQPASYFTTYTPKIATTAALVAPFYFNKEILSHFLDNQYSFEIKFIFLISNTIATAQITHISSEFLSIKIENTYCNLFQCDEKDTQSAGEVLSLDN